MVSTTSACISLTKSVQACDRNEDRISQLPDHILSYILSKLTLKDMVKTSALSHRWRYIWGLTLDLNFDLLNVFGMNFERPIFGLEEIPFFTEFRLEFINRVDNFLEHFQGTKIRSFKLVFYIDSEVGPMADEWIRSAVALGVEELELLLSNRQFFRAILQEDILYKFPYWHFSRSNYPILKHLRLQNCVLKPPVDFTGFCRLKTLHLDDVILSDPFLESLLSNCLLLEGLSLVGCEQFSALKVVHASIRNLVVICGPTDLKIEIFAANLRTFEYAGNISNLTSIFAPCLEKIFFSPDFNNNGLQALPQFAKLPQLETLSMHVNYEKRNRMPQSIASFRNLKQLDILVYVEDKKEEDLLWLLTLLNACPVLENLYITLAGSVFRDEYQRDVRKSCKCKHNRLKQVKMGGCSGTWYEIEFILHVLRNAMALEQVVLTSAWRFYAGDGRWVQLTPQFPWSESGQQAVRKSLQTDVRENVQLVLLHDGYIFGSD